MNSIQTQLFTFFKNSNKSAYKTAIDPKSQNDDDAQLKLQNLKAPLN